MRRNPAPNLCIPLMIWLTPAFLTVYVNSNSPSMAKTIPTGANFFVLLWRLLDLDIYVRIMHLRVVAGKPHARWNARGTSLSSIWSFIFELRFCVLTPL